MPDNQLNTVVEKVSCFIACKLLIFRVIDSFDVKFSIDGFLGQVVEDCYLCSMNLNSKSKKR